MLPLAGDLHDPRECARTSFPSQRYRAEHVDWRSVLADDYDLNAWTPLRAIPWG